MEVQIWKSIGISPNTQGLKQKKSPPGLGGLNKGISTILFFL
jgi:hypothetical protein